MSRRPDTPAWTIAAIVIAAGGVLCCAPVNVHQRLRGVLLDGLAPGLKSIAAVRDRQTATPVQSQADAQTGQRRREELKQTQALLRQQQVESARLRDELKQLQTEKPRPFLGEPGLPLFAPDLLAARVLDSPARDEIERTIVTLSEGSSARVALAEWVLGDDGVTIDHGRDSNVAPDQPVLAGRSVFGRVASTGRFTSRVQHVSDPAFRAHAKLIRRTGDQTVAGAEGLLVGAGEGRCRLELIPATEPVEPGDLVITAATIPGIDEALFLGQVETADLGPAASHWKITVAPAIAVTEGNELQVVRVGLHPARTAGDPKTAATKPEEGLR